MARQILAHTIIYRGKEYRMALARIADDGSVSITPFDRETHSTEFINGRVHITADGQVTTENHNNRHP